MGRIRDLFKALSTNANVTSEEEYEEVQAELRELLQTNGESESRIATLEEGLETHKERKKLQEKLKAPANAREAVEKAKMKNSKIQDQAGQEIE